MRTQVGLIVFLMLWTAVDQPALAHREVFTAEEKERMKTAERLRVDALALTARGAADASDVHATAAARLGALGYRMVSDPAQAHDITVKIKCEERKTWEGPVTSGGDADQPDAAARLWKGPACQVTYRIGTQWSDWRHEVRGERTGEPAEKARTGPSAMADLAARLADDPFPFLLAAAWGHSARLLAALDHPATSAAQRATILSLLGNMDAVEAIPVLSRHLNDTDSLVAHQAAVALGAIGHENCIPVLLGQLGHENAERRLAAIQGLGRLAPLHPNSAIVPALLARLPQEPVSAQIEIVRALGATADRRILAPLRALNRTVQERTRSDSSPEWKELRRALGQSLDQFDGVHTDE